MADDKQKRVAFSRSMKFDRDPHVKALTVSGSDSRNVRLGDRIRGGAPEGFFGSRPQNLMDEYYLRRHWATALLYDLQHRLGMGWHEIQEATGRSRAQWLNITTCKRPDTEYFIKRCEPPTFSKAGAQYEANQKKRGRPAIFRDPDVHTVSRSFIYDVCNNLKKKYTLKTAEFRMAWNQGLMVIDLSTEDAWKKQMENFGLPFVDMEVEFVADQLRRGVIPSVTLWTLGEYQANAHREKQEAFPLVRPDIAIFSRGHDEEVDRYMAKFEDFRWGQYARQNGEWNQRNIDRELEAVEAQAEKVEPTRFPTPVPTDKAESIIKKDDGSYPLADIGFHQVSVPLDVHPVMIDENGEATFTVKLKYVDGIKVGHSVEAKPVNKPKPEQQGGWAETNG